MNDNTRPVFALVDGNSFYASCEKAFRPDLTYKPVVVLSSNDGCVVARSAEAKLLGIPMGVPYFQIQQEIRKHNIVVFSSNYELYADMSARMMACIASVVPRIEVYSIDECFADLTGIPDLSKLGRTIRQRVHQWTRITTCVGIGYSKVQAKLANHVAKKNKLLNGVCNLVDMPESERDNILAATKVQEIWGVGRKLAPKLQAKGIYTAKQLRDADPVSIQKYFGVVVQRLCRELAGHSCMELSEISEPNQQIMRSRSFGQLVTEKAALQAAVSTHISNALEALREQHSVANILTVYLHTNHFREQDAQYHAGKTAVLASPSADTLVFNHQAMKLLNQLYRAGYLYKKAGIMLGGIESADNIQNDLFAQNDSPARDKLMQTMDVLNARYGRGTVQVGSTQLSEKWQATKQNLSPCYTTRIENILVAM